MVVSTSAYVVRQQVLRQGNAGSQSGVPSLACLPNYVSVEAIARLYRAGGEILLHSPTSDDVASGPVIAAMLSDIAQTAFLALLR